MTGACLDNAFISIFGLLILDRTHQTRTEISKRSTYVLLLLKDVADLEPDVGMCQRTRGVAKDVVEALE